MIRILLILFFLLYPFYLFPSGTPQYSQLVLMILISLIFIKYHTFLYVEINKNIFPMLLMFYIIMVNSIWFIKLSDVSLLIYTLYYIFNLILFYIILLLTNKNIIYLKVLVLGLTLSLTLQLILTLTNFTIDLTHRETLYFNNPNQLGYFALGAANIFFIISQNLPKKHKILNILQQILIYSISLFLIVISSSKSAIISFLILLLMLIYSFLRKSSILKKVLIFSIIISSLTSFIIINSDTLFNYYTQSSLVSRMENIGDESDDSFAGRGYDRILIYSEYTILGAGEGAFSRFKSMHHGELHSSIANILFSYGLIGIFLFLLIIYNKEYKSKQIIIYMLPLLLYSLAHNGIRSPLFWIALAVAIIFSKKGFKCINSQNS